MSEQKSYQSQCRWICRQGNLLRLQSLPPLHCLLCCRVEPQEAHQRLLPPGTCVPPHQRPLPCQMPLLLLARPLRSPACLSMDI